LNRMGVLYLMAHLLITLVIIGGYIYTVQQGQPDEALKLGIATILGYWFGAAGMDKIKQKKEAAASKDEGGNL
jgi:hypothetical protein